MRFLRSVLYFACLVSAGWSADLQITLRHTVSGEPLRLDSLRYKNTAGETYSLTRLSYLLSGFALQDVEGNWVELGQQYLWVDAEKSRLSTAIAEAPAGVFRAIRFDLGLPEDVNHGDPGQYGATHPLNPNFNRLHWDWKGGYIFLAVEGRYRARNDELPGYVYHLANDWNRTPVQLEAMIDLRESAAVEITLDLGALLNAPRPISLMGDGASTHSAKDDPIAAKLVANIRSAFQVNRVHSVVRREEPKLLPIDLPEKFTPYRFQLSGTFPIPNLPVDNPLIEERVALGKRLFEDKRLSRDNTIACTSCHAEEVAFSDNKRLSEGINGQRSRRHSMPLFNLAWKSEFFWDGRSPSLREQVLVAILDPTEMGESFPHLLEKLKADASYRADFAAAFESGAITEETIGLALENFLLTLISDDSRFDRSMRGTAELSELEKRGFALFMTEYEPRSGRFGADCFHCHGGPLFTDHQFHNNGLALDGDLGRYLATKKNADRAQFSTPSLRNVALTAPYMHDGRFSTLEEVIRHYAEGVQSSDTLDPNLAKHPSGGLALNEADQRALVAFLRSLTDEQFVK